MDSVSMNTVDAQSEVFQYASFQSSKCGIIELDPVVTSFLNNLSAKDARNAIRYLQERHEVEPPSTGTFGN